jgi:hypothetical protein
LYQDQVSHSQVICGDVDNHAFSDRCRHVAFQELSLPKGARVLSKETAM